MTPYWCSASSHVFSSPSPIRSSLSRRIQGQYVNIPDRRAASQGSLLCLPSCAILSHQNKLGVSSYRVKVLSPFSDD